MYLDFSGIPEGASSNKRLDSDVIKTVGVHCATFTYFAGNGVRDIYLLSQQITYRHMAIDEIWKSPSNNTNGEWVTTSARFVANQNKGSSFVLGFSVAGNHNAFVALKEMYVTTGECPGTPSNTTFGNVYFRCSETGRNIAAYRACDGVEDCPMGEDENEEYCSIRNRGCVDFGISCQMYGVSTCLADEDKFCDGHADCRGAIDEDPQFCDKHSRCDSYCLNEGVCGIESNQYGCQCPENLAGTRCSTEVVDENDIVR